MLLPLLLALAAPQTVWHVDANAAGPGVGTVGDPYSRIDYAVAQATTVTGDTVLIEPGTYLDEDIEILGKALRLEANGAPGSVVARGPGGPIQPGSGSSAVIRVEGPAAGTTTLVALRFVDGIGEDDSVLVRGGAAHFTDASVTIEDCFIEGKAYYGGAIYSKDTELAVVNSSIRGAALLENTVSFSGTVVGGALLAEGGSVELTDCDVIGRTELPYPYGLISGESTAFSSCSSVTITRGSIRAGSSGGAGQFYSTGGRIWALNTVLRVDETVLANDGFASSRGTGIGAVSSDVHVTGVTFDMGQTLRIQGDGMHLEGCTTMVDGCSFLNCGGDSESDGPGTDFYYYGGGLYSNGSGVCSILNSSFSDNQGSRGGAIYAEVGFIADCEFDSNTAFGSFGVQGHGGAIWLGDGSIQRCRFTGNVASGEWGTGSSAEFNSTGLGGAVFLTSGTVESCRFEGNQLNNHIMTYAINAGRKPRFHGGALYAADAVTIRNSAFISNTIVPQTFSSGGGGPALNMQGCGAYLAEGGTIEGCRFIGNGIGPGTYLSNTRWFGGGVYVEAGALSISSSTFEGNEAERGGAIYNEDADLEMSLCVLRANRIEDLPESTRTAERPAIAGDANIVRCTIAEHALLAGGSTGDVLVDGGGVDSSIFFGNPDLGLPAALPVTYSIVAGGHPGLGNLDVDPLFIATPGDVRLWPASPAIDAGNPALVDEGTSSRADMGALPRMASDCGSMCANPLGSSLCTSNPNSTGLTGETQAFGSNVAADQFLLLSATQLPLSVAGYFVTSDTAGFVPNFGGSDGNLCLGSPLYRLSDRILSTGTSGRVGRAVDTQHLPQGQVVTAGSTWTFQYWHRDPASITSTSNTTSAVSVTFQ